MKAVNIPFPISIVLGNDFTFKTHFCITIPTQATIAKCTGLTEVAVGKAVKELNMKGFIEKKKQRKRIYYYFTIKLLGYLDLTPKIIYIDTQKKFGDIPKQNLDKNILKEKENTLFSNSSDNNPDDENYDRGLAFAKTITTHLANNPLFAAKVKQLKEKYNL